MTEFWGDLAMLRTTIIVVSIIVVALGVLFVSGPRVSTDTTITFDATAIGDNPQDWLAANESQVPALRPELAKEILWAFPSSKARTPLSIVYVHGFSASKGEIRPVPDDVANSFGANIFYTRLTGHGQDSAAMGTATLKDWVNDVAEALAIGRAIGEKVVVIATSTGAPLVTFALTNPALSEAVAGVVFVSPNYAIQASGSWLLTMPWGLQLAELITGKERSVTPAHDMHARYWTTTYPVTALPPMAAAAELGRNTAVENITVPALFIFSDADKVVRPEVARQVWERWGAAHEMMVVESSGDGSNHVIAGDAFSPEMNALVSGRIMEWIKSLQK